MKSLFIFLLLAVLQAKAHALNSDAIEIGYFEDTGQKRKTAWIVESSYIWKTHINEKTLFLEVWVALPPLLNLKSENQDFKILKNTIENKSPFFKNSEIKSVLNFTTKSSFNVISLKKITDKNKEKDVRVTLKFNGLNKDVVHLNSCIDEGIRYKVTKTDFVPFLMSLHCSKETGKLTFKLSDDAIIDEEAIKKDKNLELINSNSFSIKWNFQSQKQPSGSVISFNYYDRNEKNNSGQITLYHSKNIKVFSQTQASDSSARPNYGTNITHEDSSPAQFNKRIIDTLNTEFGLYLSKLNFEFFAGLHLNLENHKLTLNSRVPLRYFQNNNRPDVFSAHNLILKRGISKKLTLGVVLTGVNFSNENDWHFGPGLFASIEEILTLTQKNKLDFELTYSPLLSHENSTQLISSLSLPVYLDKMDILSLNLSHSLLQINNKNGKRKDYKFLLGAVYKW